MQLREEYVEEKRGLTGLLREKDRKMGEYRRKQEQMMENVRKLMSTGMGDIASPLCEK